MLRKQQKKTIIVLFTITDIHFLQYKSNFSELEHVKTLQSEISKKNIITTMEIWQDIHTRK
uniref:Uncharacterized protein n=1 Tax=Anguilla anguilla TaxID=7936 RepID=A0A0E9TD01_ANGAN